MCKLRLIICLLGFVWLFNPVESQMEYISSHTCQIHDLKKAINPTPEGALAVLTDTAGYLWFFSDLFAYRLNKDECRPFSYYDLFGPACHKREFLRTVLSLPNGKFGLQFDHRRDGMPLSDTLLVFNPILQIKASHDCLPKTKNHEVLVSTLRPQNPMDFHCWILRDTVLNSSRIAIPRTEGDSLIELYESAPDISIQGLFSSRKTGKFFLLRNRPEQSKKEETGVLHIHDNRNHLAWNDFPFIRGVSVLRKHQNHNIWFDPDGGMLSMIWRHEDYPDFESDPFWWRKPSGEFLADVQSSDSTDWSSIVDLKHGYRGSEVCYHADNELIWTFVSNRLEVFTRAGEKIVEADLPVSEKFTLGLHDVYFLNPNEAIALSSFGVLHLAIYPSPFNYHTIQDTSPGFPLGCRSMSSLNLDTVLLMTDASGIFVIGHRLDANPLQETQEVIGGIHVANGDAYLARKKKLELINIHKGKIHSRQLVSSFDSDKVWRLDRGNESRWYISHEGLDVAQNGQVVFTTGNNQTNHYQVLEIPKMILVARADGLFLLDDEQWILLPIQSQFPELSALHSSCHSLLQDGQGRIWIGTKGQGLACWTPNEQTLEFFNTESGLPSPVVYGALEDSQGLIWGSTNQGLFRLNPSSGSAEIFGQQNGLPETEFNRTSFLRHLNGHLYFGALSGVISFDPTDPQLSAEPQPHPMVVDQILQHSRANRNIQDMTASFRQKGRINLEAADDFVSLKISVLNYSDERHQFSYRLLPEDATDSEEANRDWTSFKAGDIILSNFETGMSVLEIRAKGNRHGWKISTLKIPIAVRIPFYLTHAFQSFAFFALLLFVAMLVWFRFYHLKKTNLRLEAQVAMRTKKLQSMISLKDNYLAETHHRVKNNLQIISSLLDLQASQAKNPELELELAAIKSRIHAIHLFHQKLQKKTDNNNISLQEFIAELLSLIEKGQIKTTKRIDLKMSGDSLVVKSQRTVPLGLIFNELITNTIKHVVPNQSSTRVEIDFALSSQGEVRIVYDDFGPGLPAIQDFKELESLGLRLVGRFVHQLQGEIHVNVEQPSQIHLRFDQL